MSAATLVALVCCDLGSIVRGRSVLSSELEGHGTAGVGWVPANHSLTPLGGLAEQSPFGSTGDLRLVPDMETRVCVAGEPPDGPLEFVLCDILETDGRPWACCPRQFLRGALRELEEEFGLHLSSSFEHEFQLLDEEPAALPFSLEALRRAEPFPTRLMAGLIEAGAEPERIFAEFAPHQFEVPVRACAGMGGADRSVVLREVVREVARRLGLQASFTPLLEEATAGNGVHIHLSLRDAAGAPALHDAGRPACVSALGGSFAAGILKHAPALSALTAASPVSAARLVPHRWSAGAVCLAERNREALLRIPPLVEIGGGETAEQLRLEYRGADASANPYLALGALIRAGLEGLRAELPTPPILDRDPAELDQGGAARFGVGALPGTLEQALLALEEDQTVRGWMAGELYEAYVGVKRSELAGVAELDPGEVCRRYGTIY